MGSCVSSQGKRSKVTKSKCKRPSKRKSFTATQPNKTVNLEEAIIGAEKSKEDLEEQIEKIQLQIQGTKNEGRRQSLQRSLTGKRGSLKFVTDTLNRLDKAYEDETNECSQQYAKMAYKAKRRDEVFNERVTHSQTAF